MGRAKRLRYRHLRRTTIALLAATALLVVAAWLAGRALHSEPMRRLVRVWLEQAAGAVGVALEVRDLRWELLPPGLVLEDIRVESGGLALEARRLRVELHDVQLARRTVELGTVAADGVHLRTNGLPRVPENRGSGFVRLAIRHLDLRDVSFEGRQLARRLDVQVTGLDAGWVDLGDPARGFVTVERIHVEAGGVEPFNLSLRARMIVGEELEIPYLSLTAAGTRLEGTARRDPSGVVSARLAGPVDLAELDRVVRARAGLSGVVEIDASFDSSTDPPLDIAVAGTRLEAAGFPVDEARGRLTVNGRGLEGTLEQARMHGGRVSGHYRLAPLGPPFLHHVELQGQEVSVAGLLEDLDVPPAGLAARADLELTLDWQGRAIGGGRGRGVATLVEDAPGLPVAGDLTVELLSEGMLRFDSDELRIGGSRVQWEGPLVLGSWEPAWAVRAEPAVLEELIPVVNAWVGEEALPTGVTGTGSLAVSLTGPFRQLVVDVLLDAQPLGYAGIELDRVVAEGMISGSRLSIGPARYQVDDASGEASGTISWGGDRPAELDLDLRGYGLPLARAAGWAGLAEPVSGRFSFTGGLRGEIGALRGSWALGLAGVELLGQPIGNAAATVSLSEGVLEAHGLEFDGGLDGDLWWNVPATEVGGELRWRRMPLSVLGDLAATAMADYADVGADFRWRRGEPPLGRLRVDAKGARLEVDSEPDRVHMEASIEETAVARATLERVAERGLEGTGELWLESADALLARLAPMATIPLSGSGRARFDVALPAAGGFVLDGRVESLDVLLDQRPVRLLEPAHFHWDAAGLEVEGLWFAHHEDEIFLRWAIDADGTVRGNMSGTLDALLLRFLIPEWEPDGQASGVVELLGTIDDPRLEGIVEIDDGSFRVPGTTTILSAIDGTALLSADEAILEGVGFRFMRGQARASGRITVRDGRVELGLDGQVTGLEYPLFEGFVPRLAGSWRVTGPVEDLLVSGDLRVVRATLRRKDDLASILFEWLLAEPTPPEGEGVRLDLAVEADRTLEAVNAFLNLEGSASLRVGGTSSRPGVVGTVAFEEGGEVSLQGVRYELDRAILTFVDPKGIDALVDIQGRTWVQSHQITVNLSGTPERLVPTVSSDPPLPQDDIYAMLAVGRRGESAGGGLMGVGLASSLLTRELNTELQRRAQLVLPVDQVRVDPFAESSTGNPAARVTVVKQLDPRWTVMLQSNLSGNRDEVIVSRWFLAPGIFVEATRDLDGSYALDLKVRRRY